MSIKKILITGGAGFIGTNLTKFYLEKGIDVIIVDNFSTGKFSNLPKSNNLQVIEHDLINSLPARLFRDVDMVMHFSANADIRHGMVDSMKDIEQNIIVTEKVMNSAVKAGCKDFIFASSAAVFGEPNVFPTPENIFIPRQTSLYGMSKLAGEGILSAYAENYGIRASAIRFVSIVGDYYAHGHVIDFYNKLLEDPYKLEILGDGQQRKSYLHINDMMNALDKVVNYQIQQEENHFEIYNFGNSEYCKVTDSANVIISEMNLDPEITYTGGKRGWVGDSPFVHLDTSKIINLGWKSEIKVLDALRLTIRWLINANKKF